MVRGLVIALAGILAAASPVSAQDDTHGAVGFGPSFLTWQEDYGVLAKGGTIDLAHPFGRPGLRMRWVADVGIMWEPGDPAQGRNPVTDTVVLGGLRFTIPVGSRFNIDLQGLLGVAHFEFFGGGETAFTGGPGAALRYWLNDRVGLKGQVDYQIPRWDFGKLYRYSFGLVIGLPPG
jgi:hypothetical protein